MIRRHSATAIFMHWYNAACWLLLLFTGFALLANPLMQPVGDWWSSLWTGAFGALGLLRLHVVVGMAWIVLYAAYLLVRARAEALPFLKEITDLHIGSDLVWCSGNGSCAASGSIPNCLRKAFTTPGRSSWRSSPFCAALGSP